MSLNKNNIDVPEYLNIEFFERALKNGLEIEDIQINNIKFTMGSKPGENYCSVIYVAEVDYTQNGQDKIRNLLVKSIVQNVITPILKEIEMFQYERDIYSNVLSKMANILNGEKIVPRFFYYDEKPIDTIVLEFLNGYKMADRVKGFDEAHCSLVLKKLAKYHAASMVIVKKHPEILARFNDDIVKDRRTRTPAIRNSFMLSFKCLANVLSTWPGFEVIAEKIERFSKTAADNYVKWHGSEENELKVLVHNDLWVNNILFKYQDDTPIDVNFVDFQTSFYSSPGIDLCHLLYTSLEYQLLEDKRDFLIKEHYYKTLKSTLEKSNYEPIPTLEEIEHEINKREVGAFLWAIIKLHVISMDPDKSSNNNFDTLVKDDIGVKIREQGMASERYVPTMKYILKRMEGLGILK